MKILVTGTLGFIGSNFIRHVLKYYNGYEYQWVGLDKAVHSYNLENQIIKVNYNFYLADISDKHTIERIFEIEKPDMVIGMAAESFVDLSITDIMPFLQTNVIGTQVLINACLKYKVEKYVHISTDEIYGQQLSRSNQAWIETDPLLPRNPYAASKAAGELIVRTAAETHGLKYQMTRSCNVFGPRQKKENLIPHIIHQLKNDQPVKIHGNGENFRQYISVLDKTKAIMKIILNGKMNETYNIGAYNYLSNLEMVEIIGEIMNKKPEIEFIADRKAHDMGYSISNAKLQYLEWQPQDNFKTALTDTVMSYMGTQKTFRNEGIE